MREIAGLTVLVTGANRGIGHAFVDVLMDEGAARVVACARNPADLDAAVQRWGARVVPVRLDVTRSDHIAAAADRFGDVDLVVSNAGITSVMPFSASDEGERRRLMDVNFHGPANLTAAFLDAVRQRHGGFIYILSMGALIPGNIAPIYGASKAACEMMAFGVRSDLAPDGGTVTLAYPGFVDTGMSDRFDVKKASAGAVAEEILRGWRKGECTVFPDDYARLVRHYLVEDMDRLLRDPDAVRGDILADHMGVGTDPSSVKTSRVVEGGKDDCRL